MKSQEEGRVYHNHHGSSFCAEGWTIRDEEAEKQTKPDILAGGVQEIISIL